MLIRHDGEQPKQIADAFKFRMKRVNTRVENEAHDELKAMTHDVRGQLRFPDLPNQGNSTRMPTMISLEDYRWQKK